MTVENAENLLFRQCIYLIYTYYKDMCFVNDDGMWYFSLEFAMINEKRNNIRNGNCREDSKICYYDVNT